MGAFDEFDKRILRRNEQELKECSEQIKQIQGKMKAIRKQSRQIIRRGKDNELGGNDSRHCI